MNKTSIIRNAIGFLGLGILAAFLLSSIIPTEASSIGASILVILLLLISVVWICTGNPR